MPATIGSSGAGAAAPCWRSAPSLAQDCATQAAVAVSQFLVILTQHSRGSSGFARRVQPTLVLCAVLSGLGVMLAAPRRYMRNRSWLNPLLRCAQCLPPSARAVGVGTAMIMERAPQPGLLGAIMDLLRVATGMRILPLMGHSAFQQLPPLASLLTHLAITALTWNPAGYCATRLLSSPLSRLRQQQAARVLEYAALPMVAAQPAAGLSLPSMNVASGCAPPEEVCVATVSLLHVALCLLLPLLLSVYNWHPQPGRGAELQPASGSHAALCRAAHRANCWLHCVLGGSLTPALRALLLWYIFCNFWVLAKLSAGL